MNKLSGAIFALCSVITPAFAAGLLDDIPPPPNAKALGNEKLALGGEEASYSTSTSPADVILSYKQTLAAVGWTVTSAGGSGSEHGGGAGLEATQGARYLAINAGGPAGTTFVHVCAWPKKPKDDHCGG